MEKILIEKAIEASKCAYAPYSKFYVGAAVRTEDNTVIVGCNVENASFGLTNCAERTALFSARAQGHKKILELAIYVDRKNFTSPCGACRQVIKELAPDAKIILINSDKKTKYTNIDELLPLSFDSEDLQEN